MPAHTKCCTCQAKSSQQNLKIGGSKMQPLLGNQRPDLVTALMNMFLVLCLPWKMHLCRSSSNDCFWKCYITLTFCSLLTRSTIPCACHAEWHLNVQKSSEHVVLFTFWLRNVLRATTAYTFSSSQLPKMVRSWCVLYILTWKCASRHNGVRFFDIATSKNTPELRCFVHFDLETCFAPQEHALFRHLNFQKWSEPGLFSTFWLGNVLRATTACNFSSLIWPAGSAPAALASLLFVPPEPQIIGKTQWIATFLPFRASPSIFFLLILSLLTLLTSAFQLSILSEVSLLNFLWLTTINHH